MINKEQFDNQNLEDGQSGFNRIVTPSPKFVQVQNITIEQKTVPQPQNNQVRNPSPPQKSKPVTTTRKKKHTGTWWLLLLVFIDLIFFTPVRVNTLILGIDRAPKGTWLGRSDTMMVASIPPCLPQVSILSIPRDLWVTVPNHYENRINTAHYFAELEAEGSGKQAAAEVVEVNFGIPVDYVVRIKFDGFVDIVDAMGGVTVNLPTDMSGLTAGEHHLDGTESLRFVRDRAGSDDFFRQQRQQLFISAAIKQMLNPVKWVRIPLILTAAAQAIDTDLPVWLWPRVGYSVLFSAFKGFDTHTFDREMITSWTTDEGAMVLLPNWDLINPLVNELFK